MWALFNSFSIGTKIVVGIAIIALLASISAISYNKGLNVSKLEIAEYQTKIQQLNAKKQEKQIVVNEKVIVEYKDRIKYIDKVVYTNRDVVKNVVVEQFNLSKGWIYSYNQSVKGLQIDPEKAKDSTPSTTSEMLALADTILPNNGICLANQAKLEKLQEWIKESLKNE